MRIRISQFIVAIAILAHGRAWNAESIQSPDERSEAGSVPIPPFAICMMFEKLPPGFALETMEAEVERAILPAGPSVAWKLVDDAAGNFTARELVVVSFRGLCQAGSRISTRVDRAAPMGSTQRVRGTILPYANVDCDQVREAIHNHLATGGAVEREFLMGRAVGRVVAHELYHILAGTEQHNADGLGKAFLNERDLTADGQGFRAQELLGIRRGLAKALGSSWHMRESGLTAIGGYLFKASGCGRCHGSHGQGSRAGPKLRGSDEAASFQAVTSAVARHTSLDARGRKAALDEADIGDLISFLKSPE
jgi:mono/diheme cytochrome c family protein